MCVTWCVFFFKQKTAYELRISDWSSDVCSSDLRQACSAYATAAEQVDDRQQDDRADQGGDESHDVEPAAHVRAAADQGGDQPAADEGADDADHDVQQDALLGIGTHDHAERRDRKSTRLNSSH